MYGYGVERVAHIMASSGVDAFAMVRLDDAVEYCRIDLTTVPEGTLGAEVVIIGRQGISRGHRRRSCDESGDQDSATRYRWNPWAG